jgi:hypothetical protein
VLLIITLHGLYLLTNGCEILVFQWLQELLNSSCQCDV